MADETTTTAAALMRQYRGPLAQQVTHQSLFIANIQKNTDTKRWDGANVEIPVVFNPFLQGAQAITETGTVGNPETDDTGKTTVSTGCIEMSVSLSVHLMKQLQRSSDQNNDPRGAVDAVKFKMQRAAKSIVALANEASIGAGDGLLAAITGSSSSGVLTIGTTANYFLLYIGRKVDIRTRSSGAAIASGTGVKITAVDAAAGTVTVDNTPTVTSAAGIYIINSGKGNNALPQGIDQAFAGTTFQSIDPTQAGKGGWQGGTYGNSGTGRNPKKSVFDTVERGQIVKCGDAPDFYVADPAVADGYGDLYMDRFRIEAPVAKLETGFQGYSYKGKAILPMFEAPAKVAYGLKTDDIRIYTLDETGPNWDDLTGAMWQRFSRVLPVEAWLVWFYQMGFSRLAAQAKITDLNQGPLEA